MTLNNLLYPSTYVSAGNNTPPSWYEFLLKPDLMKQHLSEADPDPSASSLIKQFFEQANRPVNDQGQILPPQDNLRNKKVRKLALQAAAHMKWDLNELDAQLSISVRHQLLSELMKACHAVTPPPQNALESMHDHTISALVLYYRWSARIVMKSTFPRKPGGRITPTVPQAVPYQANAQQRMDELRNQILGILKQQLSSMVPFLEAILHHIERPIYLPSYETIGAEQLCSTDDKSVDIMVSCEELHAQISYDLGCLHFAHNFFDKAGEMFINAREWMKRITSHQSAFCSIDKETLESYQIACHMLVKPDEPLSNSIPYEHGGIYMKVVNCLKQKEKGIHELKDLIIEDIYKKELSSAFLNDVERSLLYKDAALYGGDALFDIKWTMGLHRAVKGVEQPVCVWTEEMNVAQLHRIIGFVQQISPYLTTVESDNVGNFLCSLANNLSESSLRSQLLNFEVTRHLINGHDLNNLVLRLEDEKLLPRVLEDASPSSPEDCSTSPSTSDVIKSMERELLMTLQPHEIKATLNRLHSATSGRRFNNLCLQWELPASYGSAFTSISDPLTSDFIHISIAKARHCTDDQDYSSSKSILQYLQANHTSDTKLQKLVGRELLKVELLELLTDNSLTYSEKDECNELRTQLSDVVTRCRHLITNYSDQSKQSSLPSNLVQLSISLLLNLEDFAFFISISSTSSTVGCVRFASLVSALRASVSERSPDARRVARDVWSAAVAVFAAPTSLPTSSGRGQKKSSLDPIRNLLPTSAIISRPELLDFIKLLKNPHLLQIMVSLLTHLHRLSRNDILSDITSPNSAVINALWPANFDGAPTSGPCVTLALRETITHCLAINQKDISWLRTQGDMHYVFDNFGSALRCYLLMAAYETNYFTSITMSGPYEDEQIVRRMVKCCMQMRCFTQAAVLCQLTKEVDYPTAFKALQSNRELTDAADLHYLDHIWDIELLEHAAYEHKEAGEGAKKSIAVSALARPELNHSNSPAVGARTRKYRKERFFQAMARHYLC